MNHSCRYDILGFTKDLGLNLEDVHNLYNELINEINFALAELKIFIAKNDITNISKIIHNVKGVTGNYRLIDIYEETTKINDALKSNNYNSLKSDLNNLINICYLAVKEIQNYFSQRPVNKQHMT
ncbi:Hpt domain-containing protein [Clostridium chromiireducens]|uniref:Hpt domain-containing protein n=1 Tax=Clostridium chromiireducens TaxID=225345 RepID=A0A399IWU2_9CLOT|nr:Hpt domain-containing protein [Clostridium chromiireducens]RII36709.1 Hpt domain-containing protein [Clostridium chromiireducens]